MQGSAHSVLTSCRLVLNISKRDSKLIIQSYLNLQNLNHTQNSIQKTIPMVIIRKNLILFVNVVILYSPINIS